MKNMLKLLVIPALLVLPFMHILPAHAADLNTNLDSVQSSSGLANSDLYILAGTLISVFLSLLGIIFLILVLYAGFLWMTAGGEEDKVEKAKDIMIRAVVGLIIILAAYSISSFVLTALADLT